jgi:hypothetical protein
MQPQANTTPPSSRPASGRRLNPDRRVKDDTGLSLVQVDPRLVVRGVRAAAALIVQNTATVGKMRETCPHCHAPLQLVLRYKDVIRSHLYCEECTRCFDARYPDGSSALTLPAFPIE